MRVHVLVLRAFRGPRPAGMVGCHRDDNPANNLLGNLRWDFPLGNGADAVRNNKTTAGEKNRHARLTRSDVDAIRNKLAAGVSSQTLADMYGVAYSHIRSIAR